jgi:hypothetical protein
LVKEVLSAGDFWLIRVSRIARHRDKIEFTAIVFKNIEKTSVKIYIFVSVIVHGNH